MLRGYIAWDDPVGPDPDPALVEKHWQQVQALRQRDALACVDQGYGEKPRGAHQPADLGDFRVAGQGVDQDPDDDQEHRDECG